VNRAATPEPPARASGVTDASSFPPDRVTASIMTEAAEGAAAEEGAAAGAGGPAVAAGRGVNRTFTKGEIIPIVIPLDSAKPTIRSAVTMSRPR